MADLESIEARIEGGNLVNFSVMDCEGYSVPFRVPPTVKLQKVIASFADYLGGELEAERLLFNSWRVGDASVEDVSNHRRCTRNKADHATFGYQGCRCLRSSQIRIRLHQYHGWWP